MKIVPFEDGEWIKASEGLYWICTLAEDGNSLDYSRVEERKLAVEKLNHFHTESYGLRGDGLFLVSLKRKWMNRLMKFEESVQGENKLIKLYTNIGHHVLEEMDDELTNLEHKAFEEGCIVHGDPAHHNFIYNRTKLMLIDGDLVSYAPREYDYLQLMIRMLPFSEWSLDEWFSFNIPSIENILNNPTYTKLLAFPADFYREWLIDPEGRDELLRKTLVEHDKRYPAMLRLLS
ncbi:hypothetical protein [Alkalihalobacillus sp. CinArs1]|uniref:hypothetical protein n=1 Tax=Alkalihalobacillus sp. CinArs1 TaxID=2995314 RepID=UPI0022DD028B|nr:hypothetical protein [Alkalihalobacillus sp. CinArs1]